MTGQQTLEAETPTVTSGKPLLPEKALVVLSYCACGLIWGTTWFAIRVSVSPGGFPPYMAIALRFTMATAVFAVMWAAGVFRPSFSNRKTLGWIAAATLLSAAGFALVYQAERCISGGLAAIIGSTAPLVMAAVAIATRAERVSRESVIGALVGLGGLIFIFQDSLGSSGTTALAVAMAFGSVVLSTTNNAVYKHHTKGQDPLSTAALFSLVTGAVFWMVSAMVERQPMPWPPPAAPLAACAYLAVLGSVVAFVAYFYLIKRVRLMTISTLAFYPPLIALGVDALFEKAFTPSLSTFIGMGITLAGVAISLFGPRR